MNKPRIAGVLIAALVVWGCKMNDPMSDREIIVCPTVYSVGQDSVLTGTYLGMTIEDEAEKVYAAIQALQSPAGVSYVNIVGNSFKSVAELESRIPLYQGLNLDRARGTDAGVQLAFEEGKVKTIYLNSGTQLSKWPATVGSGTFVRVGDDIGSLHETLAKIERIASYAPLFERISLFTKDLSKGYDPVMAQSSQWYFAYKVNDNRMDEVKMDFREGRLVRISIQHYQL